MQSLLIKVSDRSTDFPFSLGRSTSCLSVKPVVAFLVISAERFHTWDFRRLVSWEFGRHCYWILVALAMRPLLHPLIASVKESRLPPLYDGILIASVGCFRYKILIALVSCFCFMRDFGWLLLRGT